MLGYFSLSPWERAGVRARAFKRPIASTATLTKGSCRPGRDSPKRPDQKPDRLERFNR
jgi:hypothetical protein